MLAAYDFYTVVRIRQKNDDLYNQLGVISGKAQNDEGIWTYAVFVYSIGETFSFYHDDLEDTGRQDKPEKFYTNRTIRAKVDPETGEGSI